MNQGHGERGGGEGGPATEEKSRQVPNAFAEINRRAAELRQRVQKKRQPIEDSLKRRESLLASINAKAKEPPPGLTEARDLRDSLTAELQTASAGDETALSSMIEELNRTIDETEQGLVGEEQAEVGEISTRPDVQEALLNEATEENRQFDAERKIEDRRREAETLVANAREGFVPTAESLIDTMSVAAQEMQTEEPKLMNADMEAQMRVARVGERLDRIRSRFTGRKISQGIEQALQLPTKEEIRTALDELRSKTGGMFAGRQRRAIDETQPLVDELIGARAAAFESRAARDAFAARQGGLSELQKQYGALLRRYAKDGAQAKELGQIEVQLPAEFDQVVDDAVNRRIETVETLAGHTDLAKMKDGQKKQLFKTHPLMRFWQQVQGDQAAPFQQAARQREQRQHRSEMRESLRQRWADKPEYVAMRKKRETAGQAPAKPAREPDSRAANP